MRGAKKPDLMIVTIGYADTIVAGLVKAFEECGWNAVATFEGSGEIKNSTNVLLFGSINRMRNTVRVLRNSSRAPRVVAIWSNEPFPPESTPDWAILVGRHLSPIGLGALSPLAKLAVHLFTFPVYSLVSFVAFGRNQSADRTVRVKARDVRFLLENFATFLVAKRQGWADIICVSTLERMRQLAAQDIEAIYAPVGQQPFFGWLMDIERDVDVLVLARVKHSKERKRKIEWFAGQLSRKGVNIRVVTSGLYGQERTHLLNRTKVLVNLHNHQGDTPWMRWLLADACGAMTASEPIKSPAPFRPNIDYVDAPLGELPNRICSILNDEEQRQNIVKNAHKTIKANMTLGQSVDRISAALLDLQEK